MSIQTVLLCPCSIRQLPERILNKKGVTKVIVRIKKRAQPFVLIDKRPLENPKLSLKAKGLLSYLMSKPEDWQIFIHQLAKCSTDRKRSIASALAELQRAGHARLETIRADEKGRLRGKQWIVFEEPIPHREARNVAVGTDEHISRSSGKPTVGKCATTNNNSSPIISGTDSCFSRNNQITSTIPSNHREIIDRFNEKCAGIVKGGRRVTKCTERLANAIRVALNNTGGVKPLFDLFDSIADGRVTPLQNKFTLTGLLWAYVKGQITVTPKRFLSVGEQQRKRREKMEEAGDAKG